MKTVRARSIPVRPPVVPPSPAAPFADIPGGGGAGDDTSDVPEQAADVDVDGEGTIAGVPLWLWLVGGALLWTRTR